MGVARELRADGAAAVRGDGGARDAAHADLAPPLRSPKRSRIGRRIAIVCGALLGLLVLAALTQPWWLAPWVGHRLSASSGRSVAADSMWIGLGARLQPVVHASGVRIENAPWADGSRPLAAIESIVAEIAWRSLSERRPVIALMTLARGAVDLELQADGHRNWRLGNPEDLGPGRVKVMALRAEQATVRFVHGGIDLVLEAHATPSRGAAPDRPTHIDFEGAWRAHAFRAQVETAEVLTFMETGTTFPLQGRLEAGGVNLDVDGRAGDVLREPVVDAAVRLEGRSLAAFADLVGVRAAEPKAFRVEGRVKAADHVYALSVAHAKVGDTTLAGEAEFRHAEPRSRIVADLKSETADVADLLWLAGRGGGPRTAAQAAKTALKEAPAAVGSSPGYAAARRFDAEIAYRAAKLRDARFAPLESVALKAALNDGRLDISALDVGVAHGHATGQGVLDLTRPEPVIEAKVAAHGLRLEDLWHAADPAKRITGVLQGRAELQAVGDSVAAWLGSASGHAAVKLTAGSLPSLLDAELGLQGGKMLRSLLSGSEPVAIRCAGGLVELRRGKGAVRSLVVDTERTRTTGTGTVDLPARTFDLVLTPVAKQGGLFVLDRSIRLSGPMLKPEHALVGRTEPPAAASQACAA